MAKNGYGIQVDFWAVPMQLNVQGVLDNWKMLDLDTIILSPKRQISKWVTIDNLVLSHELSSKIRGGARTRDNWEFR